MTSESRRLTRHPEGRETVSLLWNGDGVQRVILVSNRGPVDHSFDEDEIPIAQRGAGGVVSGLVSAVGQRPTTWIALAMNDADRAVARARGKATIPDAPELANIALRLVDVPAATYERYYEGISNRILWFAQHYLLRPTGSARFSAHTRRDWETGYRVVNETIAEAVIEELRASGVSTPVLFQDYHLYLAPAMVRAACPDALLEHFVHIPWPESRYWEMLPDDMVREIFAGLAANDVIGFQTDRDARNFLEGAERFLDDVVVQQTTPDGSGIVLWQGRRVLVRAYPIAVTPREVQASANSPEAVEAMRALREELRLSDETQLIVRVDRIEPTKNIVRGFQAYEHLLKCHKELRGRVTFLALLVPSRQGMAEYRRYERRVRAIIDRINARYGQPDWQPIVAIFGNDRARALACMRRYDVLLVNPVIDGMNLVVKEGGLVNRRPGVIVLSRTAGAYEQLRDYVIGVPPMDVQATAEALAEALATPREQRMANAVALKALLNGENAALWLDAQISDVREQARLAYRRAQIAGAARRVIPLEPEPEPVLTKTLTGHSDSLVM
ncbi:MAG: alpha,alpha-trehalose-phosphate synthase (UDP-forming) [Nitrososphaerota archaeon]